jgi:F-type H+-transporting ATPase subunit a
MRMVSEQLLMIFLAADPLEHVLNFYPTGEPVGLTMHLVTLLIAAALTILVMLFAAKRIETGPASQGNERYLTKGRIGQVIEAMVLYLRDEMIKPVLGEEHTRRYLPYLMTVFFFILFNNILGLLPLLDLQHLLGIHATYVGGTATGNINVTGGLAVIAFIVILVHAIRELGFSGFLGHMTGGLHKEHWALWTIIPIVFAVEFAGLFIKPAALAIRLFANMLAGHTLLAVLLSFGAAAAAGAGEFTFGAGAITVVSVIASVLIMFLEVFVAFLQAFIFMFLTAVFISLMSHHDEHEHDEGHAEAHAAVATH